MFNQIKSNCKITQNKNPRPKHKNKMHTTICINKTNIKTEKKL